MQKNCTQCTQQFKITSEDLEFYEKVSPAFNGPGPAPTGKKHLIPAPTLCPQCRVQRRMAWRNDRTFYHRKSDLSGKQIISIYPPQTPFPVYHQSEWYGDSWNPMDYGQDFDFNRPFFDQWNELALKVPRLGMDLVNCENSDYCNYGGDDKNCYLDIAGEGNEDCYFNLFTKYSKNCVDCTFVYNSTLCYESIQCYNCYNVRYSMNMEDCSDCAFCLDCKGSKNCLFSTNLRNKEYCIFNQQHTKEEYQKKLQEMNMQSHESMKKLMNEWKKFRIEKGIYKDMQNKNCENCLGDGIKNSKNCQTCFNTSGSEDCKYLYDVLDATDCQDLNYSLYKPEAAYELISTLQIKFSAFNMASHFNYNVFYCDLVNNSKNLFGCIGLNQKEYCILNKQYTKEEYEKIVPRIIEHMIKTGEWGEFFPVRLSAFGYNETVAQEYMPLTQAEVQKRGWAWKNDEEKANAYMGPEVKIPDNIKDVPELLCKEILICEISKKPYKIIPQELKFYKQIGVPVPRKSPAQRHHDRNELRPARQIWSRTCAKCGTAIKTAYAPDRPEKVYCESCYLKEVY